MLRIHGYVLFPFIAHVCLRSVVIWDFEKKSLSAAGIDDNDMNVLVESLQSLGKQGTPRPSSRICNTIVAQDTNPDLDEVDPPHPYQVTYASCREGEASSNTFPSVDEQEIEDMARVTRTADVVVIAVGYPELVTSSWIKEGAIVLDVGINVMNWGEENPDARGYNTTADARQICRDGMDTMGDDGDINPFHVVGDVHFASVSKKASAISPVPGGIGPMTIAALLQNTIRSAAWRLGVDNYVDVEL